MAPIRQTFRYDVFLSFRGEDTRNTFTSHLYKALRHHFDVFHDSSLQRGLSIAPQLLAAIKESKIFVVVFSTNYADSKWCLDELSQMMCCVHTNTQHMLLPVFLDVNQSDVDTQQGSYMEPFTNHETKFDQDRVQKWREALQEAGHLPGLHLQNDANGDEKLLVDQIVERVRKMLHEQQPDLNVADPINPVVGIGSRVHEVISLLNSGSHDDDNVVRVVVVFGASGIGKTTIAKATYDHISINFKAECCCFLSDVKTIFEGSDGKVKLQKKFLSYLVKADESRIDIDSCHQGIKMIERIIKHQKVLLVVDDVDNDEQLKVLGMSRVLFGSGSRIIVTTRDHSVVGRLEPDAMYKPRLLDETESMKLFCLNSFRQNHPKQGYEELSGEAVRWGAGRPKVINDSAAHLRHFQNVQHWEWALKALMHNPS